MRNLDFNLLLSLNALLEQRNVTRAADQLRISQPSMSAALQRLRRHFDDELLHRNGNRYEHTVLATQLIAPTRAAIAGVERVFDATPTFDPDTSSREFTLLVTDFGATILGEQLSRLMREQAPGVRLRLEQNLTFAVDHLDDVLRTVDGLVLPRGFLTDTPATDIYEDSWVCIVAADNPHVGATLSLADLAALPWVVTFHGPTSSTPALRQLQMIGVEPTIHIVVESFLAVPFLVADTDRIALLQASLAHRLADTANIRVLACPWDVVPLKEAFWWHPMYRTDPAHAWLRQLVVEAGRAVGSRVRQEILG